jgi:hypothetical protein
VPFVAPVRTFRAMRVARSVGQGPVAAGKQVSSIEDPTQLF